MYYVLIQGTGRNVTARIFTSYRTAETVAGREGGYIDTAEIED